MWLHILHFVLARARVTFFYGIMCSLCVGAECVNAIKEATTQVDSWLGNKNTWSMAEKMFKYVTIVTRKCTDSACNVRSMKYA